MVYLRLDNSGAANLDLLVNNSASVTKEYDEVLDKIEQKQFTVTIKALQITTVALASLAIFVGLLTKSVFLGCLIATSIVVPIIKIIYVKDEKSILEKHFLDETCRLEQVYLKMRIYFREYQKFKEDLLIDNINCRWTFDEDDARKRYLEILSIFEKESYSTENEKKEIREFKKLNFYAKQMICRMGPPRVPSTIWKKLTNSCDQLINGRLGTDLTDPTKICRDEPYVDFHKNENGYYKAKPHFLAANDDIDPNILSQKYPVLD